MATLVLTAAGSLLRPIGGAVGALLGQAIDGRILRPKGRDGPRLQDLRVQASSYGAPLPKLFGTIIGNDPSGVWTGRGHALAVWTDGGWRFADAVEGMRVWAKQDQLWATYKDDGWNLGEETATKLIVGGEPVVGARGASVAAPVGGATVDTEARQAIAAIIARLEEHGLIEAAS